MTHKYQPLIDQVNLSCSSGGGGGGVFLSVVSSGAAPVITLTDDRKQTRSMGAPTVRQAGRQNMMRNTKEKISQLNFSQLCVAVKIY